MCVCWLSGCVGITLGWSLSMIVPFICSLTVNQTTFFSLSLADSQWTSCWFSLSLAHSQWTISLSIPPLLFISCCCCWCSCQVTSLYLLGSHFYVPNDLLLILSNFRASFTHFLNDLVDLLSFVWTPFFDFHVLLCVFLLTPTCLPNNVWVIPLWCLLFSSLLCDLWRSFVTLLFVLYFVRSTCVWFMNHFRLMSTYFRLLCQLSLVFWT